MTFEPRTKSHKGASQAYSKRRSVRIEKKARQSLDHSVLQMIENQNVEKVSRVVRNAVEEVVRGGALRAMLRNIVQMRGPWGIVSRGLPNRPYIFKLLV